MLQGFFLKTPLVMQMGHLTEVNSKLLERASDAERGKAEVEGQVQHFRQKLRGTLLDNEVLQQELALLKKQVEVSVLCVIDQNSASVSCVTFPDSWSCACSSACLCCPASLGCVR